MSRRQRARRIGADGLITQVRPAIVPDPDHDRMSSRAGRANQPTPLAGRKGARQLVEQSVQPSSPMLSLPKAANLSSRRPVTDRK